MHPIWFHVFGYPVHWYATLIATGFVVGVWLAARYGKRVGYDKDLILDLCWWLLVSGLVGSRIAFIIVNWDQYWYPCFDVEHFNALYPKEAIAQRDCTRILRFWNGGLVFYGGVIGAILVMVWFLRREKLRVLPVADVIIPSLAIGQFFGRLGCHAAGCCWGKPTDVAWSVRFPARSMAFSQHLQQDLVGLRDQYSAAIHPTQLYDAAVGLLLFFTLLWIRRRKRYHGQVFIWWMLLYPLARSTIEMFRGDSERGYLLEWVSEPLNRFLGLPAGSVTFLSTSQFISLGVAAVAMALIWRQRRRRVDADEAVALD